MRTVSHCGQGLEFLAEVGGVDQLQEGLFSGREFVGFGGDLSGDEASGVLHEEGFLGVEGDVAKPGFGKAFL